MDKAERENASGRVTVAESAGFCFGVKRAVQLVYDEAAKDAGHVYTLGPIIHNEYVVNDLKKKGVGVIDDDLICEDTGEIPPEGSVVIIRSHGVSEEMYSRIKNRGYKVVDATCPFVKKIHTIVKDASLAGYPVIIIGNPDHPEVRGIRGWVSGDCAVIENEEDARNMLLPKDKKIALVSQTTFNYDKFQELVEIITFLGYHQKLYDICRSQCANTYYIQDQSDLQNITISSESRVGITAGASTPNTIIQEVSQNVRGTEF